VDDFVIKSDEILNATNFIFPGALVDDDDNSYEFKWTINGGYNTSVGFGLFPSYCFSESRVDLVKPAPGLEEVFYELDAVLEKLQHTLF